MKDKRWLENLLEIDEDTAREAAKADAKHLKTRRNIIKVSLVLIFACIFIFAAVNFLIDKKNNNDSVPVTEEESEKNDSVKKVIINSESYRFDKPPYENINTNFSSDGYRELKTNDKTYIQTYITIDEKFITGEPQQYLKFCFFDQEYNFYVGKKFYDDFNKYVELNCNKYKIEYIYE